MQVFETRARSISNLTAEQKQKSADRIKKIQKEGEKLTTGIFEFVDAQGGWFDFSYRFYPGEPVRTVKITHGEVITIPMDLAKHLNNVYKKVRVIRENADGGKDSLTKISRTRFIPTEMLPDLVGAKATT